MNEELQELSALRSLDLLTDHERQEFERRLASGDLEWLRSAADFDEVVDALAQAQAVAPPPHLKKRLMDRIHQPSPVQPNLPPGLSALVRGGSDGWNSTPFPGITSKRLFRDRDSGSMTFLVRMEPGSSYPSHRHAALEHCYVLEGDLRFGDQLLHAGDYMVSEPSSVHCDSATEGGCLILIVNNVHDELLH